MWMKVQDISDRFRGRAVLIAVDKPVSYHVLCADNPDRTTSYVIASAAVAFGSGPEVYLFPADKDGKILDWCELSGSRRGTLDWIAVVTDQFGKEQRPVDWVALGCR